MKATMKKSLNAIHASLAGHLAKIQELLSEEESYACDLEDDDKIGESEQRQEGLQELGELLETSMTAIEELVS